MLKVYFRRIWNVLLFQNILKISGKENLKKRDPNSTNQNMFKSIYVRKILTHGKYKKRRYATSSSHEKQANFSEDFEKNHIPLNMLQRSLLTIGSAAVSLLDPHRGDMIACLGETTGSTALTHMLNKMENSKEGSDILRQQPRINSKTIDIDKLKQMPEGTLGKVYSNFLQVNQVTPDSRLPVQFVDDVHLAYVIQRYREVHDLVHAILGMKTNMLGEVTVKWVEAIQTKLPMCVGGALFGPLRLKPKHRKDYLNLYLPWAIETGYNSEFLLNIFFENRWEQPISELHKETNIKPLVLVK